MQRDRAAILGPQLRNTLLQGTHQRAVTVLQQVDGLITRPHDQKLLVPGIEQGSMGTYPHARHFLNPLESTSGRLPIGTQPMPPGIFRHVQHTIGGDGMRPGNVFIQRLPPNQRCVQVTGMDDPMVPAVNDEVAAVQLLEECGRIESRPKPLPFFRTANSQAFLSDEPFSTLLGITRTGAALQPCRHGNSRHRQSKRRTPLLADVFIDGTDLTGVHGIPLAC